MVLDPTTTPCIPGCCPIVRQLKTWQFQNLGSPQNYQRRYIWSRFVDLPWECFQIKRRWGNLWKTEFPVLGSVFCRHANVSFNSKADTVSSFKVHPGLTCWWLSTQIISEGEPKPWHQKSSIGAKVWPMQKLKYRSGFTTTLGKLEKKQLYWSKKGAENETDVLAREKKNEK